MTALLKGAEPDDEAGLANTLILKARERDTRRAVDAARLQRREAIRALYREEAAERRARAELLRNEAAGRQSRVDKLLDQLEELEGVRFTAPKGKPGQPEVPRSL